MRSKEAEQRELPPTISSKMTLGAESADPLVLMLMLVDGWRVGRLMQSRNDWSGVP